MWKVPRNASVCSRCRFRISLLLQQQTFQHVHPRWPNTRAQSTAVAVAEEVEENVKTGPEEKRPPEKHKKRLRRVWKPPRVAELGVSSLGKPAEVLVLKDRDRHVSAYAEDGSERPKSSEPRILEAIQAENLPVSSENVKQSLDQIGAPYRNNSGRLPSKERAKLKERIMAGFTKSQLRSYCIGVDQLNPVSLAEPQASDTEKQTQRSSALGSSKVRKKNPVTANEGLKLGKAGLVEYIIKHKWAVGDQGDEETKLRMQVTEEKIEYVLNHKQSLLKEYAKQFNVAIDASRAGRSISIKGKPKHIHPARRALNKLCKGVTTSRLRCATRGKELKDIVTSDFVSQLIRKYNVMITWASTQDKDVPEDEDGLNIYYSKTQDLQNALNAERDILLAERQSLLAKAVKQPKQRMSMWFPEGGSSPSLVSHQSPGDLDSLSQGNAWARWALPRQPIEAGDMDSGPTSARSQMHAYLSSARKQNESIIKYLKGKNDEFFSKMSSKSRPRVREKIDQGFVSEEIAVHFGKILFSKDGMAIKDTFPDSNPTKWREIKGRLLQTREGVPNILSSGIPVLPSFLRTLSPLDEVLKGGKFDRRYRLRYIPLPSQIPPGFEVPPIEIDILRKGKPGLAVTNYVENVWAIMEEQSHKLLLPAFTIDLDFVRRLKSQLVKAFSGMTGQIIRTPWVKEFGKQIQKSDSVEFPQFVNVVTPPHVPKKLKNNHDGNDSVGEDISAIEPSSNPEHSANVVPLFDRLKEPNDNQEGAVGAGGDPPAIEQTSNPLENVKDTADSPSSPPAPSPNNVDRHPRHLHKIDYMLEGWEQIHSTCYKAKAQCLEHLNFEGETSDKRREVLRLAMQPLLQTKIEQISIPALLERAYKIAAHLNHPYLLAQLDDPDMSVPRKERKKSGKIKQANDKIQDETSDESRAP
jgi:Mitochondrial inner-membrane-bound regulator